MRDPQNPNKKQKIYGYNLVLSTSVELDLKLELPVAATNISGNGEEGKKIITNTEQINAHHNCVTKKEDLKIIDKPILYNKQRADILVRY